MLVALIADSHWGWKNDSMLFFDYFMQFYNDIFFPTLQNRNVKTIIHLGDLFDRRKYINFHLLHRTRTEFLERLVEGDYETHIIVGNHDTYFKDSNDVNSLAELCSRYSGIHCYQEPTELSLDGLEALFIPWLNPTNIDGAVERIKESVAEIAFGHLEINGFQMEGGDLCEHGLPPELFAKFTKAFSGHFHHPHSIGNIQYLGSPYQLTFGDLNDTKGFYIFNTDTRDLEFIANPYKMFHKLVYDDRNVTMNDLSVEGVGQYSKAFVKVVVAHVSDPYLFDQWIENLSKVNPADMQIDQTMALELEQNVEEQLDLRNADGFMADTLTVLNTYVDSVKMDIDKTKLKELLKTLYSEAVNSGSVGVLQ